MPVKAFTLRQAMSAQANGLKGWADFDYLLDAMHKDRGATFKHRLNWDVEVDEFGWEIDKFDDWKVNPLYLISVDDDGEYRGSLRLLPTTGPNMLADVFPQLLDDSPPESATIWESSRITSADDTFAELVVAIGEVAQQAGVTQVVTVVDERIKRLLRIVKCPAEVIGTPQPIGGIMCYALSISDPELLETRERCGLPGPVLEGMVQL